MIFSASNLFENKYSYVCRSKLLFSVLMASIKLGRKKKKIIFLLHILKSDFTKIYHKLAVTFEQFNFNREMNKTYDLANWSDEVKSFLCLLFLFD